MGKDRLVVYGVNPPEGGPSIRAGERPPVALGMVMAYARTTLGADEAFDLEPRFVRTDADADAAVEQPGRLVFLFSNYLWNYEQNLELSRRIKARRPDAVTIHGGANTPAYPAACEEFLRLETHVDFVVRGEGETALVDLLRALAAGEEHRSELPSASTLIDGRFVQFPVRERSRDLDDFPSPYTTGVFDPLDPATFVSATIETNRGCPYGCTFCDWGAATLQKIRTFSLERVRADIAWVAEHRLPGMWIADANFGILPRDVEVAKILAESKRRTGYPKRLTVQYSKNTHKHMLEILEIFFDVGLIAHGIVSIQTRDRKTLEVVRRTNIKTDEYDKLKAEFQKRGLPLATQLMFGMPGATLASFEDDLRHYFDEPIEPQIYRTMMLANSPMAEPTYREAFKIKWREDGLLTSTSTMNEEEFEAAEVIARTFNAVQTYGILRYLLCFLQWEYSICPISVLHDLAFDASLEERLPLIWRVLDVHGNSIDLNHTHVALREDCRRERLWGAFHEQFIQFIEARHDIVRDSALEVAMQVQTAVMPAQGRRMPDVVQLQHDFVRYYADHKAGRGRPLREYGPGTLHVDDPLGFCERPFEIMRATRLQWELANPLAFIRAGRQGAVGPEIAHLPDGVALPWALVSVEPEAG